MATTAGQQRNSAYFTPSPAMSRAWQDVKSFPGIATKLRYMLSRLVTTEAFIRAKYPNLAGRPLPVLYARRFLDLIRHRAKGANR